MFVFANLLDAVTFVLNWLLVALEIVIVARAVLSWVNADPYNGLVRAIVAISEPFLKPFRRLVPPWRLGGVDLSPVFAILAIVFVKIFLIQTLSNLADKMR